MNHWIHFLQNKPQSSPNATLNLNVNNDETPRHLIMPNSWVNVLEVPRDSMPCLIIFLKKKYNFVCFEIYFSEYLMLYPNGKKVVLYMNAIKEYFADYVMPDGLIEKTTFYDQSDYVKILFVNEIYKHRIDKLIGIEITYTKNEVETIEYFESGRDDCLRGKCTQSKYMKRSLNSIFSIFF